MVNSTNLDVFGIKQLYPTAKSPETHPVEWHSTSWADGHQRILSADLRQGDPHDPWVHFSGEGAYLTIFGNGEAMVKGIRSIIAIANPTQNTEWFNTEVTMYHNRLASTGGEPYYRSQGWVATTRSNYFTASICPCDVRGYTGSMLYTGNMGFQKQIILHRFGNSPYRVVNRWKTGTGTAPKMVWIGFKFVCYNISKKRVKLEIYRDMEEGSDGGRWVKMGEMIDSEGWRNDNLPPDVFDRLCATCYHRPARSDETINTSGRYTLIRNANIVKGMYKWCSVREIEPQQAYKQGLHTSHTSKE